MKVSICGSSIILLSVIFLVKSAPTYDESVQILKNDYNLNPDGSFQYKVEQSDGTETNVRGILKNVDGNDVLVFEGSYKYTTPDLIDVQVEFVADENGYVVRKVVFMAKPIYVGYGGINPKAVGSLLG